MRHAVHDVEGRDDRQKRRVARLHAASRCNTNNTNTTTTTTTTTTGSRLRLLLFALVAQRRTERSAALLPAAPLELAG